jgi:amino acid transporter
MGDEIKDPQHTLPGAVVWGGIISGILYIATTLTLLVAVSKNDINVLQGIVQAVSHMAQKVGVLWIVAPFALMLSISIAGIGSAWLAGSARIPFVAGLDSYLPSWLGKVHPRYGTPYAALMVHFVVSTILVLISFLGSGVQETFQRLLSLAVVLQLLPFLYMFAALLKIASDPLATKGHYGKTVLWLAGSSGLLMTILGMIFAFSPAKQISSVWSYEAWMVGGTAFFIGLAVFFFFVYGRRKTAAQAVSRL